MRRFSGYRSNEPFAGLVPPVCIGDRAEQKRLRPEQATTFSDPISDPA